MRRRALPLPACAVLFALVAAACGLPRLSDYHRRPLAQTTFVYAADGSLITTLHASEDRVVLTYAQMPQSIRDAAVAIEDRRFYLHHGFDLRAIARAAVDDAAAGQSGGRWLHHHPAAREEPLRRGRPHASSQDRRGRPRLAVGGSAVEGPDPDEVPEHRLPRRGRLRRPGSRRDLLREEREGSVARGVCDARRTHHLAEPLRSLPEPDLGPRTSQRRAPAHAPTGVHRPRERARRPEPTLGGATSSDGDHPLSRSVLHGLLRALVPRQPGVRANVRRPQAAAVHGWPARADHARSHPATRGGIGGAVRARISGRPRRRDDRDRSHDRLRARDDRRQGCELLVGQGRGPRQPRHGGRRVGPPDGLGLQALRPRHRPRARHLPQHHLPRAGVDRHPRARRRRSGRSRTQRATATAA